MPHSHPRARPPGAAATSEVFLISTIVIQLILALGTEFAVYTAKQLVEHAKKWLQQRREAAPNAQLPSDKDSERVARVGAQHVEAAFEHITV
jgi:hypothetical protein